MSEKPPPLVEVIFELRWGNIERPESRNGEIGFNFDDEEVSLLPGQFKSIASEKYPVYKRVNREFPMAVPHQIGYQYWTGERTWPCIQLGLGIMAVNHANRKNDYDWSVFASNCMEALQYLDTSHHLGIEELPAIGAELRYQDAYLLEDGETDGDFITKRAQVEFSMPKKFMESELLESGIKNHDLSFIVETAQPKGVLINHLSRGEYRGKPAFIQNTSMRSADALSPRFDIECLRAWLEEAHKVQQHTYNSLILPTHEGMR